MKPEDQQPTAPVVLLDATAVPQDRGGVGRYVDGFVPHITGPLFIACQARDAEHYRSLAPEATVVPQPARISSVPLRFIWEQLRLPSLARRVGATVIHSPHYTLPLMTRRTRVVTFHDATFFSDPSLHTRLKRTFFSAWIRVSARLADAVIVPSKATASELERFVSRPRGYDVAYHGVDQGVFYPLEADEREAAANRLGLSDTRWIAFLGTIEPRKNLPHLVRAYRELVGSWSSSWGALPVLALAGGNGWEQKLQQEVDLVRAPGVVRQLGFLPLDRLRDLLGGAEVVCYPSLGEGFGLPVLEGMACGAPVLTTRRLALPEVGGEAVAYCDTDVKSIESGLRALMQSDSERLRFATLGRNRSLIFTWAASARVHEDVFARAASHNPGMRQ